MEFLVEEFILGILWGHQDFLKSETSWKSWAKLAAFLCNVYFVYVYLGRIWTGHSHQNVMQDINPVNRPVILGPVNELRYDL